MPRPQQSARRFYINNIFFGQLFLYSSDNTNYVFEQFEKDEAAGEDIRAAAVRGMKKKIVRKSSNMEKENENDQGEKKDGALEADDEVEGAEEVRRARKRRNQSFQIVTEMFDFVKEAHKKDEMLSQVVLKELEEDREIKGLKKQLLLKRLARLGSEDDL